MPVAVEPAISRATIVPRLATAKATSTSAMVKPASPEGGGPSAPPRVSRRKRRRNR